ncbi:pyridoxal phosphate-dependent aminotransferase [Salipiger sp. IMCC34102]|uniref:MalY/PatB family protein n=1 Tax=Salipiger sp. IMCC34102 TaxID=2510647 RepID=UPI00101DBE82|nr:MalY/PatB family protein [Salipiger sp. IMCC34102]RYH01645.1 pyridoxal phosphate-dependent aminotransferase [Salipiger sp. IMCC34102]
MDFDTPVNRRDTHCVKWDAMEQIYGVPRDDGIAMWVADMEFQAAEPIRNAVRDMVDHGVFGYFGDDSDYRAAICWWMQERHGWSVDPAHIFTTHGLVNGTAMCVDAFTSPGDGVVLMTPVYHAFARVITAADRQVVELELVNQDGRYEMDFDAWDRAMTGSEKMLVLCSPHNPGGRVWTRQELEQVADFARRHDLVLVSDEIHHDLTFPGQVHTPMALIEDIQDRLVMMTSTTKTFNIAGAHTGNVIIADPDLRTAFAARIAALGLSPNSFGLFMTTAAYTPDGAAWVDAARLYLDENRRIFDEGVNKIPGVHSMPLEATYLAWVDFTGTGMSREEFTRRVERDAQIAANHGPTFGTGGESFLRFNIAAPRAQIVDAVSRLQTAFEDLQ